MRQLPQLLREHRPDLMVGERLYRSPAGGTSWSAHWAKAVAVELAQEEAVWEWDADGVKGTAAQMEQLSVHALLVQLYAKSLVSEGEIPPPPGAKGFGGGVKKASPSSDDVKPPVWLGKDYQLQRQSAGAAGTTKVGWQRGHWKALSPLAGSVAAPLEWVEPVLVE